MQALKATFIAALVVASTAMTAYAEKLTIATVNNSDMIIMQELSSEFTKKTGHELNWVTLEENVLLSPQVVASLTSSPSVLTKRQCGARTASSFP